MQKRWFRNHACVRKGRGPSHAFMNTPATNEVPSGARRLISRLAWVAMAVGLVTGGRAAEWQTLFSGKDLAAWKTYGKPADAPVAWVIEDGVLAWRKDAGNLATKETYGDFELELEWKISPGGNSGVMFGVDENSDKPWHSGPELQILDDTKHRDGRNPLTAAGSLYSLYPPLKQAAKPVGEWNTMRVRVQAKRVQSWLNGQLVVDVTMGNDAWKERVAKSKFGRFRQFGQVSPGRILLQDHNEAVWFKNIWIRRL